MIPYLCIRVDSTIRFSFKWIGSGRYWLYTALSSFRVSFTLNSVFIPTSNCVWRKCHDSRLGYLQLLVSLFPLKVCQSNQIVWRICFEVLYFVVDWVFLSLWVPLNLWGFVSLLGCDTRVFQDFQVSGTRKCCFAARVYSLWEVHLGSQSGQDHLVELFWGLPCLLVSCA